MVQPATGSYYAREHGEYNRFEKWFNPQRETINEIRAKKYNRFEKWFNPQPSPH